MAAEALAAAAAAAAAPPRCRGAAQRVAGAQKMALAGAQAGLTWRSAHTAALRNAASSARLLLLAAAAPLPSRSLLARCACAQSAKRSARRRREMGGTPANRTLTPRAPEKGVFPLDHFGECKEARGACGCGGTTRAHCPRRVCTHPPADAPRARAGDGGVHGVPQGGGLRHGALPPPVQALPGVPHEPVRMRPAAAAATLPRSACAQRSSACAAERRAWARGVAEA
jgi:hypothetical protein